MKEFLSKVEVEKSFRMNNLLKEINLEEIDLSKKDNKGKSLKSMV